MSDGAAPISQAFLHDARGELGLAWRMAKRSPWNLDNELGVLCAQETYSAVVLASLTGQIHDSELECIGTALKNEMRMRMHTVYAFVGSVASQQAKKESIDLLLDRSTAEWKKLTHMFGGETNSMLPEKRIQTTAAAAGTLLTSTLNYEYGFFCDLLRPWRR